mmetsp:Transcript_27932/g.31281  ORF Transcript_27932/g.31281 Transcript_27932/m.31281 type:complete len:95 (-) Transcript_27932:6-290(-)
MARQWPIRSRVRHEKTSRYPNIIAFYESVQIIHTLYSAFIRMAKHYHDVSSSYSVVNPCHFKLLLWVGVGRVNVEEQNRKKTKEGKKEISTVSM